MRYLLCGINAKYIHSNLAIFCLKAYGEKNGPASAGSAPLTYRKAAPLAQGMPTSTSLLIASTQTNESNPAAKGCRKSS